MVKKLFKHEAIAYIRTLLPMYLITLGIGLLTRFVYLFETESTVFSIIGTSSIIAFIVACVVSLVMTFVNIVTRFYKNLFTHEGYLSFTLPVTGAQHIFVKLITGMVSVVCALLVVIVGICIATAGEMTVEIFKAVGYIINFVRPSFEGHFWYYVIECIIAALVFLGMEILLFYACIAVGQLSKKNRVRAAIGVYFGYYFFTQIIGTIVVLVMNALLNTTFYSRILAFIDNHPFATAHIGVLGVTLWSALLGFIYFLVTNYIIKKKINLE